MAKRVKGNSTIAVLNFPFNTAIVHLRALAEQWQNRDRDAQLALRGSLLQETQADEDLDELTREFVQFSVQAEQAEAAAERKHWKKNYG